MQSVVEAQEKKEPYRKVIIALSIILPLAIAVLFKVQIKGYDFSFLPPIYATLNGLTAVILIAAVVAIKKGRRKLHESLIKVCLTFSGAFLVMYVMYHMTSEPTTFGGTGLIRYIYFFVLISHILLSVVIIPLVLFTYARALAGNFTKHKALAKFAFPLWVYVAVTGVVVYIMISPYYK